MSDRYEALRNLFTQSGYQFVEPPIVHPAGVFVDLAGEDLRRRLYLTSGADGAELALRPDYTIPVCLAHIAAGEAKRRANYAYLGPVFRIRREGLGEFHQAGVESLGRTDRIAADADILKLAFAAANALGVRRPTARIGDSALFAATLDALDLNAPWRRRLARAFGDTPRLKTMIKRAMNGKSGADTTPLAGRDRAHVRRAVEGALAETGLGTVAGRTADEIAERFMEKSVIAKGIDARAAETLSAYLAIDGKPAAAVATLRALSRDAGLGIDKAVDRFEKRVDAFSAHGIDVDSLTFAAEFGRRLDYYTGFVFEFHAGRRRAGEQFIGGGRYDHLLSLIAGEAVPAIGFAIWLERIGGKA